MQDSGLGAFADPPIERAGGLITGHRHAIVQTAMRQRGSKSTEPLARYVDMT